MANRSSERGRRAGFDPRTGAVHGSGSGAGGKGNPNEDYDNDPQAGGRVEPDAADAMECDADLSPRGAGA